MLSTAQWVWAAAYNSVLKPKSNLGISAVLS